MNYASIICSLPFVCMQNHTATQLNVKPKTHKVWNAGYTYNINSATMYKRFKVTSLDQ